MSAIEVIPGMRQTLLDGKRRVSQNLCALVNPASHAVAQRFAHAVKVFYRPAHRITRACGSAQSAGTPGSLAVN